MAETITLGKVSVSPKGAYSSTASYTFLDAVSHNGGAFLCLQNSTGVEPGVSSGWQSYWMETSKGIKQISVSSAQEGQATITVTLSDGTVSTVTFDTGVVVAQTGEGPPTTATVAAYIGQLYIDTTATENPAYICVGITTADNVTTYVWQPVGGTIEDGSITAEKLAPNAIPNALGFNPGMVNPNLLDNWYFGNPVNQRGSTTGTGGYFIDRWGGIVTVGTGYLTFQADDHIYQRLEETLKNALGGKTVTASILYGNGELDTGTTKYVSNPSDFVHIISNQRVDYDIHYFSETDRGGIAITTKVPTTVVAVKLELGSRQTLAHQENGVWVLNEIPDYSEQLARCQRYYYKVTYGQYVTIGLGYEGPAYAFLMLPLPVEMRTRYPSLTMTAPVQVGNNTQIFSGCETSGTSAVLGINYNAITNAVGLTYCYCPSASGVAFELTCDL